MMQACLRKSGSCWIDLMWTREDGWWIEEVQPSFSRVSKVYSSEAEARAAFDADEIEWLNG